MTTRQGKPTYISIGKIYQYKHLVFEYHDYFGPQFLRHKDHEAKDMRRVGMRAWGVFRQWYRMPSEQRERYRLA